jgi:hypothetical protein
LRSRVFDHGVDPVAAEDDRLNQRAGEIGGPSIGASFGEVALQNRLRRALTKLGFE